MSQPLPQQDAFEEPSLSLAERELIPLDTAWLSIWMQPRDTMYSILSHHPSYMVLPLGALFGVRCAMELAFRMSLGDFMPAWQILTGVLVGGCIFGVMGLFMYGALVKWTGSWLGGKANYTEARAAVAWSSLPSVVVLLMTFMMLPLMMGHGVFTQAAMASPLVMVAGAGTLLAVLVTGIWSYVLKIMCLAEAHQFSGWKGFGSVVLADLLIGVMLGVVMIPLFFLGFLAAYMAVGNLM